jgi:site-specific DNA-cytosine methylase
VVAKTIDGNRVEMPTGKLDLYVLGFPCTPWSLRGEGAGFDDENCKPFWAGISTIMHALPKTFVMENAGPSSKQPVVTGYKQRREHQWLACSVL